MNSRPAIILTAADGGGPDREFADEVDTRVSNPQYLVESSPIYSPTELTPKQWPNCIRGFVPVLLSRTEAIKHMAELEKRLLKDSKPSSVRVIARPKAVPRILRECILDAKESTVFRELWKDKSFLAWLVYNGSLLALMSYSINGEALSLVNRFIIRPTISTADIPEDKKRLRVSGKTFRWLLDLFDASPSFVSSLSDPEFPLGFCSKSFKDHSGNDVYTFWYILPVRTATVCLDEEGGHALSIAGSNQMDPSNYLHLGDIKADLRPSRIGIYARHDGKSTTILVIDFQDGRWYDIADEPYNRLKDLLEQSCQPEEQFHPLDIHAMFLSISVRWWTQVVSKLRRQLVYYETELLAEDMKIPEVDDSGQESEVATRHLILKKCLHAIRAHCKRYKTELEATKDVIITLSASWLRISMVGNPNSTSKPNKLDSTNDHFKSLERQYSSIIAAVTEMEAKATTVLELLAQVVSWRNDALLVSHGNSTRKLLKSARSQAKSSQSMMLESHRMARDTRLDSVSMKTIAILTMAFLPATSFAAILAMPFFNNLPWLDDPVRVWIWIILTVPTTVICMLVYQYYTRRELNSMAAVQQADMEEELESIC